MKILHGRHPDRGAIADSLNQFERAVFTGTGGKILTTPEHTGNIQEHTQTHTEIPYPKPSALARAKGFVGRLQDAVQRRGVRGTLRVAASRLRR